MIRCILKIHYANCGGCQTGSEKSKRLVGKKIELFEPSKKIMNDAETNECLIEVPGQQLQWQNGGQTSS